MPDALPSADALYDGAPCGLLLADAGGHILQVNRTLCTWLGREAGELQGMRLLDLLDIGGRIFYQTHLQPLLRMQGSVAEVKLQVRHAAGHTVPMMLNLKKIDGPGGPMLHAAFFIAEDRHKYERELLLERRRAETLANERAEAQRELQWAQTRLRLALETAHLYVWDATGPGGERHYEASVARLLGYPQPQPVDPREYEEAIAKEDRWMEAQAYDLALDPAVGQYQCTYRLQGVDGVERTVSSVGRGFFDERGRLTHVAGVLQDVTETSRAQAQAQDRALFAEQMVGIVSHDLRNPLNTILMSTVVLSHGALAPQQQAVVKRITNSAQRATRLIADLLDFTQTRLGSGLAVHPRPIDLHDTVADAVAELRVAFAGRELVHVKHGPPACNADADRLTQLIGNLVGNAMSYGAPDQPVTVTSRTTAAQWEVSVHNDGEPIPPHVLPHLFEPMIQGKHDARGGRGVGLGLYIVREIARAHRGRVEADSTAEAGTTFRAVFPHVPSEG